MSRRQRMLCRINIPSPFACTHYFIFQKGSVILILLSPLTSERYSALKLFDMFPACDTEGCSYCIEALPTGLCGQYDMPAPSCEDVDFGEVCNGVGECRPDYAADILNCGMYDAYFKCPISGCG